MRCFIYLAGTAFLAFMSLVAFGEALFGKGAGGAGGSGGGGGGAGGRAAAPRPPTPAKITPAMMEEAAKKVYTLYIHARSNLFFARV